MSSRCSAASRPGLPQPLKPRDRLGIAPQVWAVILLVIASAVGLGMALTRRDSGYLLVFVWSFVGIAVKQVTAPNVVMTAWIAAGAMLALAGYSLFKRKTA